MAVEILRMPSTEAIFTPGEMQQVFSSSSTYLDENSVSWMRPTSLATPLEEMRHRYETDGYLWVKNLIPREEVFDAREAYFSKIIQTGILKEDSSPRDGIFNLQTDFDVQTLQGVENPYLKIPEYQNLLEHHNLRSFTRDLTGWKKLKLLNDGWLRHIVPGSLGTPIHYDRLCHGNDTVFHTAWIPIGDCTLTMGGKACLEDSTLLGRAFETEFANRGKDLTREDRIDRFNLHMKKMGYPPRDAEAFGRVYGKGRWLFGGYEAGDVVFHNRFLVHRATKNLDPLNRIQLATVLKFADGAE